MCNNRNSARPDQFAHFKCANQIATRRRDEHRGVPRLIGSGTIGLDESSEIWCGVSNKRSVSNDVAVFHSETHLVIGSDCKGSREKEGAKK
jgi:hypothetical protein